ncbi:hypothetical protein G7Z17_g12524 [Cylindrodendrum hubeiense]|uniref:Dystroglycan-type cadherin-like domain-containing protein n=1 Tax=Cylindrodendrum hubeiense TaxID=595255 RepID=A0A9P5GYR4_9HYPO|nr:hypothetical protein G7Z17_g12524 [Cylindrodendrum hubeiense]
MAPLVILFTALHLFHLVRCEPTVNFPLNSQLPPVARLDEPFSYTFSPYTFKSDSTISYSLGDAPKWLSINSKDGRLYGTPTASTIPSGDVVGQTVEIIADDGTGSSTLNATLVVSRNEAPSINIPLADQIGSIGDYSAPSSLLLYPSTDFSFSFDPNTFNHEPKMINYYASSNDSSPLPSWVKFSSDTLTFTGKTPPFESLIQPPQTFGFKLIASDIVGFSAAYIPFYIVVGSHKLSSDSPTIMLNATRGKKLSYNGLLGEIKLDKKAARPSEVEVSIEDMPDWLSFDKQTWAIEGTPKQKGDHSANFTISFRDSHLDTLSVVAIVNVATRLFSSTIDDMNIRAGEDVDIDLEPYFWDPSEVDLKMSISPQKDWLDLDGFNITGKIPKSATGKVKISLTASSKTSDLNETATLNVKILASTHTTSSASKTSTSASSTSAKSTSSSEATSSADKDATDEDSGLSTTAILLATILPILAVALIVMLLVCCLVRRRRRSQASYLSTKFRDKISGPVLESLRVNGTDPSIQEAEMRDGVTMATPLYRPTRAEYSDGDSSISPMSSPILDVLATPEVPARFMAEDSMHQITRTESMPVTGTTEGRQSWYTVATATATATARRSETSTRSHGSDTTFSESTHQLLPPPAFLSESGSSFRSGLDLAIPSLEDLPNMRQSDIGAIRAEITRARNPSGFYSSAPDSSLAFSSSHQSSPRLMTGVFSKRPSDISLGKRPATADGTMADGTTLLEEAAETVPEMTRPGMARLASQQWMNRQHSRGVWYDTDGSSMGRSFRTEPSFGSMENWRVLPNRREASISYQKLVEAAPFHPSRPSTAMSGREGARPGERSASTELMSPSQWGDAKTSIRGSVASQRSGLGKSASRYSRLSEELLVKSGSRYSRTNGEPLGKSVSRYSRVNEDPLSKAASRTSKLNEVTSSTWKREDSGRKSEAGSFKAFL